MSASLPIMTTDLARRLAQAEARTTESRFAGIASMPGNPLGACIRHVGAAVALTMDAPHPPIPNLVFGLSGQDEEQVGELVQPPLQAQRPFIVGIVPHLATESLLARLRTNGLVQSEYMTEFYGRPAADAPLPPGIQVEEFHGETIAQFAEILVRMQGAAGPEQEADRLERTAEFTAWRGYIASIDGRAVAHGAMAVWEGVAVLGFATTRPEWRGRGCQTGLLRRRLADAASLGCDLVMTMARPGGTSERNIQRAGLQVAFTRAEWTPPAEQNSDV